MAGRSPFPVTLSKEGEDDIVVTNLSTYWSLRRDGYEVLPGSSVPVTQASMQAAIDELEVTGVPGTPGDDGDDGQDLFAVFLEAGDPPPASPLPGAVYFRAVAP